ncbi:MAG TPA: hypothetical protein VF020_01205 [Chthoniobacterales bacterium]
MADRITIRPRLFTPFALAVKPESFVDGFHALLRFGLQPKNFCGANGLDPLLDLFDEHNYPPIFDPDRPSYV